MTDPVPFQGRIPVDGHVEPTLSPWVETAWPNDAATIPAQTPHGWTETNFSNDNNTADANVMGIELAEDTWA